MKNNLMLSCLLALAATSNLPAQDPAFREAERRRQPDPQIIQAPSAPVSDDTSSSAARINSMSSLDDSNLLRIEDRISLRIVEDRDKVLSLVIQDSGDIQAPFIGLVRAAGKTCKEVAFFMKRELEKQYFQQATVIVALERRPRPSTTGTGGMGSGGLPGSDLDYITIYGQVGRQGRYELTNEEELTVSQAILRAGGFSQFAKKEKVKIIRKLPQGGSVDIIVNLDNIMRRGRLQYDIPIRPNDVIIVDEKLVNF